jgi:hypothetical protein
MFLISQPQVLFTAILIAGMVTVPFASAEEQDAKYSTALTLGSSGLGIEFSSSTDFSFKSNDHIQWRAGISGADFDFDRGDDVEIGGIDYEGDINLVEARVGLDWFPSDSGWSEKVFTSGGLMYSNAKFDATADGTKGFAVGGTQVNPGDITSFRAEIENQQVMPYLSLGWGNKITGERGLDFQAEIGVRVPTGNPDVNVSAIDPSNLLSSAALATEKKDIENDISKDLDYFSRIALSYHF